MHLAPIVMAAGAEECFRYLVDPRNRPAWQSSLRAVELYDEDVRVGTRWRDVTVVGIRPELQITRMEPFRLWQERGTWRGVEAWLTLRFAAVPEGTRVSADFDLAGRGPARLVAVGARRLAPAAIHADLRRAAGILENR